MPDFFNPATAGPLEAVIGYIVSGAENFEAYLVIQNGTCRLETSPSRKSDLLIRTPAEVWLAITRGELDGQQAFFQQAFQAEGDLGLLMRMKILFSGRNAAEVQR
jgi:putative sterol carrier protein